MLTFRNLKIGVAILLLCAVPLGRTNGCGIDFQRDEFRIVWFNPRLTEDPALHPFDLSFYYGFQYAADPELQDYRRNCQEWMTYLGPEVRESDVLEVLYKKGPEYFLDALEVNQLSVKYPRNAFIRQLLQPEKAEALNYLKLAMQAEFAHFSSSDPWELDETQSDFYERITPLIRQAQQKVKTLEDPFLKRRYAYQLVVQFRYAENADECTRYCEDYFGWDDTTSVLVPWAQFHKAEVIATQGDLVESAYLMSKVFDHSESKKIRVFQFFDPSLLADVLRKARTPREKAAVYAIAAYKHPGKAFDLLRSLAEVAPNSRYLPHLITREINKLEDWMLTARVTFFGSYQYDNYDFAFNEENRSYMPGESAGLLEKEIPYLKKNLAKDLEYLAEMADLLAGLLKNPQFQRADFGHLALAHLYYLQQKPILANAELEKVKDRSTSTIQLQMNLTKLLILPQQLDIRYPQVKDEIARGLARVKAYANAAENGIRIYPKLLLHFSRLFQQKGESSTAGLFYNRSRFIPKNAYLCSGYYESISYFDRFATLNDVDEIIALRENKKTPSALEKLLLAPLDALEKERHYYYRINPQEDSVSIDVVPTLEQLYDLKGTIAFRQNRLPLALEAFEHLPDNYWDETYAFKRNLDRSPFASLESYPWQGEPQASCNKKLILRRMIELQKQAEQAGPKQAEACYLLGNAYYNFTYWGQNWMMFSYGRSNSELYQEDYTPIESFSFAPNAKTYFKEYYQMNKALDYYQKAYNAQPGSELAARIVFMMGSCDKLAQMNKGLRSWDDEEKEPYISPFFNTFRDQFGNSVAYRECLRNCPELADYFRK